MAKIPAPDSTEYPTLPDMEPIPVVVTEFTGPHTDKFVFEGADKEVVRYHVILTATDPGAAGARIWANLTRSWHEKAGHGTAGLRNFVNALHPADLTQEQILEFDPDTFEYVGRELTVFGTLSDRGYLKPVAYKRAKTVMGPATSPAQEAKAAVEEALAV